MSLYNMMFGVYPAGPALLHAWGIDFKKIERLRDCYPDEKGEHLIVYTRTGADRLANEYLRKHPQYVQSYNDSADPTYAVFVFDVPDDEGIKLTFEYAFHEFGGFDPTKRWKDFFDRMEKKDLNDPVYKNAMEQGEKLLGPVLRELTGDKETKH